MAVSRAHRNISVSVPTDLAEQLDRWTAEEGTSRIKLVAGLLAAEHRRRFEAQVEQDYWDAADEGFFDDVEFSLPAGAEVMLANPPGSPDPYSV